MLKFGPVMFQATDSYSISVHINEHRIGFLWKHRGTDDWTMTTDLAKTTGTDPNWTGTLVQAKALCRKRFPEDREAAVYGP